MTNKIKKYRILKAAPEKSPNVMYTDDTYLTRCCYVEIFWSATAVAGCIVKASGVNETTTYTILRRSISTIVTPCNLRQVLEQDICNNPTLMVYAFENWYDAFYFYLDTISGREAE